MPLNRNTLRCLLMNHFTRKMDESKPSNTKKLHQFTISGVPFSRKPLSRSAKHIPQPIAVNDTQFILPRESKSYKHRQCLPNTAQSLTNISILLQPQTLRSHWRSALWCLEAFWQPLEVGPLVISSIFMAPG